MPGVVVHRTRRLDRADLELREGIARTRVARTLIDLASVVTPAVLEAAVDDALSRRLVTCDYLGRRLESLGRRGRQGVGQLSRLLAERADGRPRFQSDFERLLRDVLRAGGQPDPYTQFEVVLPSGRKVFLDGAYPEVLVALEADSYRHHSSRTAWSRDRTRNRELTAAGWLVLPITWDDLVHRPQEVNTLVARARETQLCRMFRTGS